LKERLNSLTVFLKETNKVLSICLNDGTPLDKEKEYTVCSSKYMSSGGNDTRSISSQVEWVDNGYRIHDAIADYITKLQKIESKMDHRYKMIGEVVNDNSPW
jgi:2',3'-cyclic-nucleotide 2'-phosphodiesterase (5'-nucleotidase family)